MLDLWRRRFDFLLRGGVAFTSGVGFGVATGSRWGVDTGVGLGVEISCGAAFTSGVGFGVRFAGPPCGSARMSFPASSPESTLRRGEESQKQAVESAWAWRFLAALLLPRGRFWRR